MQNENKIEKKLTITLTDARPVTILPSNWPVIAEGSWADHDNQYEFQANRRWTAWIKVRQHADGRVIVYGCYSYSTQYQNESDATYRDGQRVEAGADDTALIAAIRAVGDRLAERSGHACWSDVIAECIAALPAEELADGAAPNPLADLSNDALLEEVARRYDTGVMQLPA